MTPPAEKRGLQLSRAEANVQTLSGVFLNGESRDSNVFGSNLTRLFSIDAACANQAHSGAFVTGKRALSRRR
jgi:hypothetical protein